MIDLTQGEGNKRVRKRNKKPTKSQLAAQAQRLPGQGVDDTPRPAIHPPPPHAQQPIPKEDNLAMDCDDDYQPQAPPMQTNFITKTTEQPQPQQPRTLIPPRGGGAMSFSPSTSSSRPREFPDLDANIDPALRAPVAAPTSRSSRVPHLSHIPPSTPVVLTPQVHGQQMVLPRPPHRSPYHRPLLPHQRSQTPQGTDLQRSQAAIPTSHRLSIPGLPHDQTNPQRRAASALAQQQAARTSAAAQTQPRTPRLPPMRTLSQSPDSEPTHTSPPPTSPPSTASGPPTSPPRPTTAGFARFARAPTGFAATGPPPHSASLSTSIRSLVVSDPPNTPSSSSSSSSSAATASALAEGDAAGGRRFVPPPPRAGIEYVQREGGGLVTARRPSGRYGEYTIGWLGAG